MSKLAKRPEYPFTGGQAVLPPSGHRTVPSQDDVIAFYKTHERISWSLTEILDIHWSEIDLDAITPADAYVAESVMLIEGNSPDYVANLIEYFQADQDVCDFVMMWAIEEWKHYYALRDYVTKLQTALAARSEKLVHAPDDAARIAEIRAAVDRALTDDITAVRDNSSANWGIPLHYTPQQVVANTTFQEFITAEFYRHHARNTKEPVLAKIETLLAKDETRHEMFYEQKLQDCLAAEPETLPSVIEALKEFGMPGAQLLDDYDRRRAAMEQAAFPTLADKKGAFVRIFGKMERIVGHDNAMRVFTEGNYLSDGQDDPSRKKMRPEMITRMLTRKLV